MKLSQIVLFLILKSTGDLDFKIRMVKICKKYFQFLSLVVKLKQCLISAHHSNLMLLQVKEQLQQQSPHIPAQVIAVIIQ